MTVVSETAEHGSSRSKLRRIAAQAAVGGLVGLVVGWTVAEVDADRRLEQLDPFLLAALLLGGVMLFSGLMLVALSYRRGALGATVFAEGGPAATPREAGYYRLGGSVVALAGLLAAAPPAAVILADPLTPELGWALLLGLVLVTVLQAVLNWRLWREADELTRHASLEGGALAFLLVEGVLFLWAAAELFGLAPAASAWAIWTLLFAAYLAAAVWVSCRRGLS